MLEKRKSALSSQSIAEDRIPTGEESRLRYPAARETPIPSATFPRVGHPSDNGTLVESRRRDETPGVLFLPHPGHDLQLLRIIVGVSPEHAVQQVGEFSKSPLAF